MASGRKLGIFFGGDRFGIVEVADHAPVHATVVLLPLAGEGPDVVSDEVRSTALIQKFIRDAHITVNSVNISLPAGDVIIRSFVIPLMKPNEIGSAVEYEVKKYVPFNLKDLSYAYHSIPIVENKIKKFRIVFVAVKKEFLEKCSRIMEQAGLTAVFTEPAPMSLVRALLFKKLIPHDQNIALVQIESKEGRVIFIHNDIVFFVREFPIGIRAEDVPGEELKFIKTRLLNEVRNSLDFYNRQYAESVPQMFVLAGADEQHYGAWLQDELGRAVKLIDPLSIAHVQENGDPMGLVNAYGVALADEGKSKVVFNLSRRTVKHSPSFMGQAPIDFQEYLGAIKIVLICAVVLVGVFFLTQWGLSGYQKSIDDLSAQQGRFNDSTMDEIQAKIKKDSDRLDGYKKINITSDVSSIFIQISALLPDGVWLKSFIVKRSQTTSLWDVEITGSAYAKSLNEEVKAVNDFVSKIRKDENLKKYFSDVKLGMLQREQTNDFTVVSFTIKCM